MRRVIPILFLLILASCREPMSVETFVPGDGPFEFAVNMTDSVAVYDFDFYSRIDARPEDCPGSLLLMIRWVSPTECVYRESVYLPMQPGEVLSIIGPMLFRRNMGSGSWLWRALRRRR